MKSMIYVQESLIPTETPFYYATKGNARILGIEAGAVEVGKSAELLKINFQTREEKPKDILNKLMFTQNYKRELLIF
jgi:cytosine/adenosine deaminase-related metal-dependent hydrolase